MGLFWE